MTNDDYAARAAEFDARIARWADRLAAATLTPNQAEGHACVACGHNHLLLGGTSVPIGYGPRGQVFVCCGCDEELTNDLAAEQPAPPANLAPAAALAALATDLDFMKQHEFAERVRAIIASLGYVVVAVDEITADATMLAAHAPGVAVEARSTGERFLTVVGEQ